VKAFAVASLSVYSTQHRKYVTHAVVKVE